MALIYLIFADLADNLRFFSRLAIPGVGNAREKPDFARAARCTPIAGVIIALPGATILAALVMAGTGAALSAALCVVVTILITGALHEDGLADCADGFFGGQTAEGCRKIAKQPTIGVFGACALIMAAILQIQAIADLARAGSPLAAAFMLCLAHGASRFFMIWHWARIAPARPDSLAGVMGRPSRAALAGAGISLALFALPALFVFALAPLRLLCALVAGGLAGALCGALARRKFGGLTGDVLGAIQQTSFIAILIGLAA